MASLVAGVLLLIASIAAQVVVPLLPWIATELGASYETIPYLMSLPPAILATFATALDVVGLLLRDMARVAVLIGATLGVSHLIAVMAGVLSSALFLSATPW